MPQSFTFAFRVAEIDLHLLHRSRGQKARRSADVGNHAAIGQARRHSHHVLLGDAHIDEALRKLRAEVLQLGRRNRIVDHGAYARICLRHRFQCLRE